MVVGSSCLMAAHGYLPGAVVSQEQSMSRVIKDFLPFLPGPGVRPEVTGFGSPNLKSNRLDDSLRSLDGLLEHDKLLKINSPVKRPAFIDLHENQPNSILLSHGISENFTRNEEISRFLTSTSSETLRSGLDLTLPCPEIGLHSPNWQPQAFSHYDLGISYNDEEPRRSLIIPNCAFDTEKRILDFVGDLISYNDEEPRPTLIIPNCILDSDKRILDFVGDLSRNSEIVMGSDGQVLFMGLQSEMKDLQSIIAEYYLLGKTHLQRKQSVVPYYFRRASKASQTSASAASFTKVKSPEKAVNKPSSRRSSNKLVGERSPYANSYSHACEILLSLIMNKGLHEKTMLLSLKKSGPELPELLTQFSVGIAGTGLSVLLTVISKMVCDKLPISSSKLLSTAIGFGFVWVSCGVNRLRDTIIKISRRSGNCRIADEGAMSKVDESMNDIFSRSTVLLVMIVLKFS